MAYAEVKEDTEEKLHLAREPSLRSWALLVGLISLGLGAAYYSSDYLLWKIAYISGAVFVGLSCMEDYEDCILSRDSGDVEIRRQSLIQYLFKVTQGQSVVKARLDEIVGVGVEEKEVKGGGTGYVVVLKCVPGYSLGVTETATMGDKTEHKMIAKKICTFLKLDSSSGEVDFASLAADKQDPVKSSPDSTASTPNGDDNSSDESFEHVDTAELLDEKEALPEQGEEEGEDKGKQDPSCQESPPS